jgi:hypothetical protein
VTTPATTLAGLASPGAPTVVVAGDNVIDAGVGNSDAISDSQDAPSTRLAGQLASQGLASGYGVVDAGIESNAVTGSSLVFPGGGVSLLNRLDRDMLAEPDVGTVIIDEGLEDLLGLSGCCISQGNEVTLLTDAYYALHSELSAFGVNVIIGTLTPCTGYVNAVENDECSSGTPSVNSLRTQVNAAISSGFSCYANFDAAVSNGATPEALAPADDAGDHVNLTPAGYSALAYAVFSGPAPCSLRPNAYPLP